MEKGIQQLVEMGATISQARAALKDNKDVMQAAEKIFEGQYDHVQAEDEDVHMDVVSMTDRPDPRNSRRLATPEGDDDGDRSDDGEDDVDYVDYDSDSGAKPDADRLVTDVDPYSGIFFSKDRREEVIEVEEEPEVMFIAEEDETAKLMTQSQWMKGCPEGGEQSFLFVLYSQLSTGDYKYPCECGTSIARKKSDFFPIFSDFQVYIRHLRRIVRRMCPSCNVTTCFACGEIITEGKVRRPAAATDDDPLFHCSNLQGVILGVGLSMLEQMFSVQSQESTDDRDSRARNNKRRRTEAPHAQSSAQDPDDEDSVYYVSAPIKNAKGGIGYAGDQKEDTSGQAEAQAVQRAKDEKIGQLLSRIRVYLPSIHRPGGGHPSDYLVHPTTLAHLRRRFNYICSSLLRNDSLADMSDRSVLYFELMEWLETISNHEALASMMAMPIMVVVSVKAVAPKKTAFRELTRIRERTIVYEGSSGPRELLEGIVIQAQAALKSLSTDKSPDVVLEEMTEEEKRMTGDIKGKAKEAVPAVSEENTKLLNFCQRILGTANAIDRSLRDTKGDAFVERMHASLPKISSSSSRNFTVEAGTTDESARRAYVDWATRVRFEYCDLTIPVDERPTNTGKDEDLVPHYKFYFNNEARLLANSDIPKRSLAIAKELAILSTNLPIAWDSSIFLRVDESRVDVMKALITGPEGTPYHNGCYLFDIFLGPSYNQAPPSVKYMTTNGGKFRFNPNLYADGKVCLSLLGTWSGPGWVSGKSTLLQVLISIQSMILCEEPYLNEPGWASSGGTPQSHAYSANVRRMVVRTAMLGNLTNPPEPFGDVIRTHFRLKAQSITSQLDRWLQEDDGAQTAGDGGCVVSKHEVGSSTNGFMKDVSEMKKCLKKLREGEWPTSEGM